MADQIYSMGQVGDVLRRIRQYNATRGLAMPQSTQTALFEGSGKAAADEASQRYWRNLAAQNQAEANRQRDEMLKMQKDAQGAQSLQGWLGLGYKGLGGEEGIKDLWGKAKDWFSPAYDVPAAYDPASAGMSTLAQNNANALTGSLGVQPETSRGLLGDYLDMSQGTLGDYFGGTGGSYSGGTGDDYLSGGGGKDNLSGAAAVSGGGLPTVSATGGGLDTVSEAGLINDALPGAYEPWSAAGEAQYAPEIWGNSGNVIDPSAATSGIPWGSGAFAGAGSAISDLLSGNNINVGKAAGATGGALGGAALGTALTGGPWGAGIGGTLGSALGSLLGGGGGSVLCTELHSQGQLESDVYLLDSAYGLTVDAATLAGYHAWGKPVARAMKKSKALTAALKPFIRAWAYHMAHKMIPEKYQENRLGSALEKFGVPLCRWIGRRIAARGAVPQEV